MADNVEIQGLEFQIVNDSTQAVTGLQNLINTLNRLKTATNGGATGLSKTAQGIRELSNSLKGLNSGDASQKITRLTNALTALSQVGNVKISSSIANQLTAINTALAGLKWTDGDKLTSLANGLRPLSELGKANMTTFINQLFKLPKVIEDARNHFAQPDEHRLGYADFSVCLPFQCILFSVLQHQNPAGTVHQGKADKLRLEDRRFCLRSDPAVCGYYHAAAVCGYGRVGNAG